MSNSQPQPERDPRKRRVRTWQVVSLWFVLMAPLAFWGLPTPAYDEFLFPDGDVWAAERYEAARALADRGQHTGGADTDADPIVDRGRLVDLTADEAGVAAILLRYRLYSRQPDEMITFMALREMHPRQGDFDPRLYQYGGGYVYLIGAALGAAQLAGYTHISPEVGFYLTQPEQFARFYVVARLLSLVFGALLLVAVVRLARLAGGRSAGWFALALVAASPVFISGVLEAKPHVPSAGMILWAILSGLRLLGDGRRRAALHLGWQAGYAFGLVLTGIAAALIWPALALAKRRPSVRLMALAGSAAIGTYAVTNPYVVHNVLFDRAQLSGNIDNSTAMYQLGLARIGAGVTRVGELLFESAGLVPLFGLVALAVFARRWGRRVLIPAAPGVALLLVAVAIGAHKPAEFARFLVLPSVLLCVAAGALLANVAARRVAIGLVLTLVALLSMRTPGYLQAFARDVGWTGESRRQAAAFLREQLAPDDAVAVVQEPAPYSVPPLDFSRRRVLLLPIAEPTPLDPAALPRWLVLTADDGRAFRDAWWRPFYDDVRSFGTDGVGLSRITWANKPVFVLRRIGTAAGR